MTTKTEYMERNTHILVPLNGKIPLAKDWTAMKKTPALSKFKNKNYGVVLTDDDLVVDVDPRNFKKGDNPVKRLVEAVGGLNSYTVKTGGGGLHIYFKKPAIASVVNELKEFKGVEFKSDKRQVVGPGSIHPDTGKEYIVIKDIAVEEAPTRLLELIKKKTVTVSKKGTKEFKDDKGAILRFTEYLKNVATFSIEGEGGDLTAFRVACSGRDFGLSSGKTLELMMEFWNERCLPPWTYAALQEKIVNAYMYASSAVGNKHPASDFSKIKKAENGVSFVRDKNGKPLKCFYNLLNFFKNPESKLYKVFGFNEFTNEVEFIQPAPWHLGMPRQCGVHDRDLKLLKAHLAVEHGFEMTLSSIEEAVVVISHENKFHPVREYLLSLTWDGVERLDTWLPKYAATKDTPYTRAVGRKVLCAAVGRAAKPGCKFDHILILEGEQGIGKSMMCKALGGDWYGDFVIDPHNKDTIQALQGKWVVEMSEMEVTKRAETQALKAFISRSTDKARLAYSRLAEEYPRQCIFIGTINPEADRTYLKDTTGNRRFWPVHSRAAINFMGLREVRNQLFAEAMLAVNSGEKLFMDTAILERMALVEAGERLSEHPWTEKIEHWLSLPEAVVGLEKGKLREFVTSRQVFVDALGGTDQKFDRRATIVIVNILVALGWESCTRKIEVDGPAFRGYSRPVPKKDKIEEIGDTL